MQVHLLDDLLVVLWTDDLLVLHHADRSSGQAMTVRIPTPKPVVPLEGYEWDFNRIGPYIRNKRTGTVSRLPNYYGPIPRIQPRWSVLALLTPALISLLLCAGFVLWRLVIK